MRNNKYPGTLLAWVTGMPHASSTVQGIRQSLFLCYPHRTQGTIQLKSYAPGPAPITCSVIQKEDEETA